VQNLTEKPAEASATPSETNLDVEVSLLVSLRLVNTTQVDAD